MHVIPGIKTKEVLKSLGVTYGQGYYLGESRILD